MKTLTVDGKTDIHRPCQIEDINDHRHAVLRRGLPRSQPNYEGDHAPTSRHNAATPNSRC